MEFNYQYIFDPTEGRREEFKPKTTVEHLTSILAYTDNGGAIENLSVEVDNARRMLVNLIEVLVVKGYLHEEDLKKVRGQYLG